MEKLNYIDKALAYWMLIVHMSFLFLCKGLVLFLIFCVLSNQNVKAQDKFVFDKEETSSFYDEIPVLVIVEGYDNFYVNAIYSNNDLLYINVEGLFKTLGIPAVIGQKGDSITGFIETESQKYSIDYKSKQIKVGTKLYSAPDGLVKEAGALYLETSLFADAFGIIMTFNYRTLTVILKSNFELPVIKQQRIEKLRGNISKIRGEVIVDTMVLRNYHLYRVGTVDWSVASYQTWKEPTDNRFSLGVGTELLYGEADVSVTYYSRQKFDDRQLYYLWRWVDNDKLLIKQAQVGRISNQTIAFINSPMIGAVVRNSPTTVRKATGYYTISEFTEPNWTVELYINNVLVDFTKADASGLYVFKVPIVYGYTTLRLKFYGPLGEEHTEERTMNTPYTVMPTHEFEYGLSAGVLQDSSLSRFGRGEFNYGVNRIITVGGGVEYLSSIPNGAFIPFAKAIIQPFNKLTLSGEYAQGVRTRGVFDFYFRKDALIEVDYTKYVEGQLATRFNAIEERKVKLSVPFRYKRILGFSKFDYMQFVYKNFNYNQAAIMISTYYKQISANSSTQLNWIDSKSAYVTSILALSYRLRKGLTIRPSVQYNVGDGSLMMCKVEVEKRISRGYLSASYERNFIYSDDFVSLNFKFDLSFARVHASASHSRGTVSTSESAQGSLAFGSGNKYVHTNNNSSVGKGGISLYPFLDLNQNGVFDDGERMVKVSTVRVMGGKAIFSEKDSIVRVADLNAFTKYVLEFNDNDLENISWRFKHKTYQVLVDPNQFKRIDIPIVAVGEVSGMAYWNKAESMKGIGRILVKIYDKNGTRVVAEILSESDGYIDFMGLEPGEYIARVDSLQLSKLDYLAIPPQIPFTIKTSEEGDIVSGIDFVLTQRVASEIPTRDSLMPIALQNERIIPDTVGQGREGITKLGLHDLARKDSLTRLLDLEAAPTDSVDKISIGLPTIQSDKAWGEICSHRGNYYVQCGAFRNKNYAMRLALYLKQNTDYSVGIVMTDRFYKVQVGCVATKREADEIRIQLKQKLGTDNMFIKAKDGNEERIKPTPKSRMRKDSVAKYNDELPIIQDNEEQLDWGLVCAQTGVYFVRWGAFKYKTSAMNLALFIRQNSNLVVVVVCTDGLYQIQVGFVNSRLEADEIQKKLLENLVWESMLISDAK